MFDRLIEFLIDFIGLFQFWEIIEPTEWGLVYTFGRDTAILKCNNGLFGTGLHLVAPFNIEIITTVNMQMDWLDLPYQSLVTKDAHPVTVQGSFKRRLVQEEDKFRKFVIELNDEYAAQKIAMGAAVATVVEFSTLQELKDATDEGLNKAILDLGRKELNQWGYKLYEFRWLQRTPNRVFRLIQDQIPLNPGAISEEG